MDASTVQPHAVTCDEVGGDSWEATGVSFFLGNHKSGLVNFPMLPNRDKRQHEDMRYEWSLKHY